MPLEIYQALLSASLGAFIASVVLFFVGRLLSTRTRFLLIGVAILVAIAIERTIWPMDNAYDPRRVLAAALGGGIGGLVGGVVGAIFDRLREGRGTSLILPLAALGFLGSELADFGSTQAGRGLINAVLPPLERPNVGDMSFDEFRAELLDDADFRNSGMGQAFKDEPEAMNLYFRWLQEQIAKGEAEGLTQSQIEERIFINAGRMTDELLLRADEAAVTKVLSLRVDMVQRLTGIDPSYCIGSFNDGAANDPRVEQLVTPVFPVILASLLPFQGQANKAQLQPDEFSELSQALLSAVYDEVGEAVFVFIGEVPATTENRDEYCAAENAFLVQINSLPSGANGPREEYYRTLTAIALTGQ